MTEPADQHLYIMQNEFGLIKIGRSVDVERRRLTLQSTERCKITTVEVYTGCGDMEEDIHLDFADHRLAGEWFEGTDESKAALAEFVEISDPPIEWPYAYNPEGAAAWLDHIEVVRHAGDIRKTLYKQMDLLRRPIDPSWVYDSGIFYAMFLAAHGERPALQTTKIGGRTHSRWFDRNSGISGIVPSYTARIDAALLAWPDDIRPLTWEGSPIECCIAALNAVRAQLPRIPRPY